MTRDEAEDELRAVIAREFEVHASRVEITWQAGRGGEWRPNITLPPYGRALFMDPSDVAAKLREIVEERRPQWEQVTVRSLTADDFAARMRAKRS
jgi:hypothetical protein